MIWPVSHVLFDLWLPLTVIAARAQECPFPLHLGEKPLKICFNVNGGIDGDNPPLFCPLFFLIMMFAGRE